MTDQEIDAIIQTIRTMPDGQSELARTIFKAAADSLSLDKVANLTGQDTTTLQNKQQSQNGPILRFTEKEISKMPASFKQEFRIQGCTAHIRKRPSGKNTFVYEIRYRRNGYNVTAAAKTLEAAKEKFLVNLAAAEKLGSQKDENRISNVFDEFAQYYFEKFYKRRVAASTYKNTMNRYNNHIKPAFGILKIKSITPLMCQNLLDDLTIEGKYKTVDEIYCILNTIFKMAIKHGLIMLNPVDIVFHKKHANEHGSALSKAEEQFLLEETKGTPYQIMFAVALYTGMRPNEYYSAKIDGKFIVTVNSKRKNGKVEYKKIPISPMLAPYLENVPALKFYVANRLREKFHTIFPDRKLYDLRTTFYTRCCECGVADAARDEFVGHSHGALGNTYMDLSDEYLLKEGQKLVY